MSEIEDAQLHSELFRRRHSTLQSHGLFAFVKHLLPNVVAQRRVLDVFSGVCLFVCVFVNTITSELGDRCTVQKSRTGSNLGVIAPECALPKNVAFGYDVGKINACCLV